VKITFFKVKKQIREPRQGYTDLALFGGNGKSVLHQTCIALSWRRRHPQKLQYFCKASSSTAISPDVEGTE